MLLKCEVVIHNRLAPSQETKKSFATFRFSKKVNKNKEEEVCFTIHAARKVEGTTYDVKSNIMKVHNRFVDDGKCTIMLKNPPHNLILSKAPVESLKRFLEILKAAFTGGDLNGLIDLDQPVKLKLCDLEKPKTALSILAKSDYPLHESFPKTLECLEISCALKKFDMRILKLQHLSKLDLSNNKLSSLCDSLDTLRCLRNVNLQNNEFIDFPSCLCSGETAHRIGVLDLSGNRIKVLSRKLLNLKNIVILKLDRNEIEYLPSNFGYLKKLKYLHMSENKLKILPWSFTLLLLETLDLTTNSFALGEEINFAGISLPPVPPLFELVARSIIRKDLKFSNCHLPRIVRERLETVKYCGCGSPCLSHCVPYTKCIQLTANAQCVSYDDHLSSTKASVNVVGYLCSAACHEQWTKNPYTLFTSKRRKRPREP